MEEILRQLIDIIVYPIIKGVLDIYAKWWIFFHKQYFRNIWCWRNLSGVH